MSLPATTSPLGDTRERPVPCHHCRAETWNVEAECDRCLPFTCLACGRHTNRSRPICSECVGSSKPGPCTLADLEAITR